MGKAWEVLDILRAGPLHARVVRISLLCPHLFVTYTISRRFPAKPCPGWPSPAPRSELDNTTFSTYYTYALSDFKNISSAASFGVGCDLVFALMKPFWAKISDIYGRGEMYPIALALITVGLVVSASASSFAAIAAGTFVRVLGMTAINSINDVIITDFTTTRERGFGVSFQFWPYIILPWVSGYM